MRANADRAALIDENARLRAAVAGGAHGEAAVESRLRAADETRARAQSALASAESAIAQAEADLKAVYASWQADGHSWAAERTHLLDQLGSLASALNARELALQQAHATAALTATAAARQ